MNHVFPMLNTALALAASAVYVSDGDWRRAVYWFAVSVITVVVTF